VSLPNIITFSVMGPPFLHKKNETISSRRRKIRQRRGGKRCRAYYSDKYQPHPVLSINTD
jgi:hypothetical protein